MGRDFKIGLICGMVPAVAALIWVATRPSLSPMARMMRSQARSPVESRTLPATAPPVTTSDAPGGAALQADSQRDAVLNQGRTLNSTTAVGSVPNPQPAVSQPDLTIYEQPQKIKTTRFYFVRRDDTLSSISQQYYGTPNQWRKILEANRSVIPDANKLQPGTKLIIPD
jgi:nucleoid-associated protein YgaU